MGEQLPMLLNYKQASQHLHIAPTTLRRWVMERKIPHIKLGRSVRFDPVKLNRWLQDQSIPVGGSYES